MAKKKSSKKSDSFTEDAGAVTADLSNLIDAAKSSLMDFNTSDQMASGAERAPLFEEEEIDGLKSAVEDFDKISVEETEVLTKSLESVLFNQNELDFIENPIDANVELLDPNLASLNANPLSTELCDKTAKSNSLLSASSEESSPKNDEFNEIKNSDDLIATDKETLFESEDRLNNIDELFNTSENRFDGVEEFLESTTESNEDLIAGTELEGFDSASIEELEFIEETHLESIIESVLFATDRPVSVPTLKQIFKGTNVTNARIKKALETLQIEYAGGRRGVTLEEVGSGFQLRTKVDNMEFLRRSFKAKSFKLSGPALEVLAITAYKQPLVKAEIDEIRGVESGHLLRALMEKNLVLFAGKSDLPGKPMQYATTRKFLEIFGLRNLKELPTLSQIDELLPDGIGDEEEKPKLADITEGLTEKIGQSYSEGEEELLKISDQLEKIDTSSEFFEKEKLRQKQEKEAEKARNLQDAIAVGEEVSTRDRNWLKKYEEQQLLQSQTVSVVTTELSSTDLSSSSVESSLNDDVTEKIDESNELELALQNWDSNQTSSADRSENDDKDDEDVDLAERFESNDIAQIDEEI